MGYVQSLRNLCTEQDTHYHAHLVREKRKPGGNNSVADDIWSTLKGLDLILINP